jgi:hypothetical protein
MTAEATRSDSVRSRPPMRNRVTPWGDIVAVEQRGAWLGNRGILHRNTEVLRFHSSALWIICKLRHRDWRLAQWKPGHFTVLFFHDEAVALAAGHRPCALCRRADYNAYRQAWLAGGAPVPQASAVSPAITVSAAATEPAATTVPLAKELDRQLHAERIVRGSHRRRLHPLPWSTLPDATFVACDGRPALILGDRLVPWSTEGYLAPISRPRNGTAEVLTPPSTVAALRGGYRPQIDARAGTSDWDR